MQLKRIKTSVIRSQSIRRFKIMTLVMRAYICVCAQENLQRCGSLVLTPLIYHAHLQIKYCSCVED